ncbi:MAG: nucleotidyltransferase family protein [Oscillospiraceae bacterium]|nr:nucleotidyltransferase family protein [Oscillospiraceae bacterium]
MNKAEKAFLVILKDAIHSDFEPSELPSHDWASIFDVARKQNLFPFIYDAATNYPSFTDFDSSNPQYFASATATMTMQMQKTENFIELYQAFLSAGLVPITMKGIICRNLYGDRADFRPSGDEDILIEKKDYEKAVEILESCGYRSNEQPDKALKAVQEVTFHSPKMNGEPILTVELHLNPFGTNNSSRERMNGWFRNVFQSNETVLIQDTPVRTMTPTDHFLFLVLHAFKHFTSGGLGVRIMLDVLLFDEKYGDRIDWEYVNKALDESGASGFMADLLSIGNEYLGFQLARNTEPVSPHELLDDMFRAGTFGNTTATDCTAGRIVSDTIQKDRRSTNKFTSYMRLLFPSWKTWISWKPYLSDKPWLLPVEWIKRVIRYLRGETSTSNLNEIDESYGKAVDRLELLKKYGIV